MAKKNSDSLFRRLTRLFRSGPVVKRKIRALDTAVAVADKTKSSGTLLFQKSLSPTYATITANAYNLSERLMRYQDFQEMEYTSEIASTLDIYADESCAQDDKGRILHIFSDNEKIRELLEDLFYGNLNVEFNLRSWVRNLVKYGDFFLYNDVHPDFGVINAFPIPVNEIEREENFDRDDPFAVRYRWVTLGNRTLENWEVSHFRLLGNDMFLPYGSSVVEPARRIWRQLILIEDAMLVYRVVRAPDRRVFYIDVANVPPENIEQYVEEQKQRLRNSQVIDNTTGRVDLRYNPLCLSVATMIKLQDGRTLDLATLIKEWESGKQDQWVYSIDPETGRYVPGRVAWAGMTRENAELVRVTLDDGSHLDVTPDHQIMLRDGSYVKAEDLWANQSLMHLCMGESSDRLNYKVKSVQRLPHREDTGCITVDQYHNFAVCGLLTSSDGLTSVTQTDGIIVKNSVDEDYIIPVRGGESGTKIDTLAGGTNTGTVEDVEYIQKKLFAALKIPRAYLGYDEMLSSKATLAQEDIRFSRSINVIQKTLIAEMNKLAIIHLYANGFTDEDLVNFTLRLSNPSTVAQQQKLEIYRAKFEIAGSIPENMGSKRYLYKNIWGLTDDEISDIDDERLREKIIDSMIESAGGEGGGGVGGGGGGGGDLFGGDAGGGDDFGGDEDLGGDIGDDLGGDEPAGDEEPPAENAGEDPEEEDERDLELLTSADDADDDERFKLPAGERSVPPIKPNSQLKNALYNRSRRRHHGASQTHMPDFAKMTGNDNDSLNDPFDHEYLRSLHTNPLGEAHDDSRDRVRLNLSPDMRSILRRFSADHNFTPGQNVSGGIIAEGQDIQDEIDAGQAVLEQIIDTPMGDFESDDFDPE